MCVCVYFFPPVYLNTLCLIFFLLRLQCQLDKQLLQLLITVVDAELLKTKMKSEINSQERK